MARAENRCCKCDSVKVWIMSCTLISNLAYANIAPFLPIELETKGISTTWIGPIFAVYSLGVIVTSPCVAKLAPSLGNDTAIALGMAGMGISLGCFGLIIFSSTEHVIIGFALATRFLQGVSSAFIQTTCYIIATDDYPESKEQLVGLVEAVTGVGLLLGPVIGSGLYAITNFQITFFLLGGTILLISFGIKYFFPKRKHATVTTLAKISLNDNSTTHYERNPGEEGSSQIDQKASNSGAEDSSQLDQEACNSGEEDSSHIDQEACNSFGKKLDDEEEAEGSPSSSAFAEGTVSCWKLAKQPRFSLALMNAALCYFMYCFLEPILAQRLEDFELNVPQIGLFFTLFSIFYIPTSVCIQWIPDFIEKRVTISISLLLSSLAFLLVGPSQILHFQDSLLMIGIGWSLLGITLATFLVPILPEMVESSLPFFPGQEKRVNSLCSGMFNSFLGIGQIISPIYGSTFYDWLGFRLTTDIAAILGLIFFLIYFVFADVRRAFQNSFCLAVNADDQCSAR